MFWDKKEDNHKLPDLPPIHSEGNGRPELQSPHMERAGPANHAEHPDESLEMQSLPSFPDSPTSKGFSQSAIKDAVKEDETDEDEGIPNPPHSEDSEDEGKNFKTIELEEWSPRKLPTSHISTRTPLRSDIFVKIDKFVSARKALGEIQEKANEIDSLLKKIRETKMREEQELSTWEKDIAGLKSRVEHVRENIFEKGE